MALGESLPPNCVPEIPPAQPTPDPWPPLQELMCVPLIKLLANIHLNPSRLLSGLLLSGCPSLSADPGWVLAPAAGAEQERRLRFHLAAAER